MDEILSAIFEGILEGVFKSRRIALVVKLIILWLIIGAVIAVLVLAGFSALKNTGIGFAVCVWVIGAGVLGLVVFATVKLVQETKKQTKKAAKQTVEIPKK